MGNSDGHFTKRDARDWERLMDQPMDSFKPRFIKNVFIGYAVKNPQIIPICIMNQKLGRSRRKFRKLVPH